MPRPGMEQCGHETRPPKPSFQPNQHETFTPGGTVYVGLRACLLQHNEKRRQKGCSEPNSSPSQPKKHRSSTWQQRTRVCLKYAAAVQSIAATSLEVTVAHLKESPLVLVVAVMAVVAVVVRVVVPIAMLLHLPMVVVHLMMPVVVVRMTVRVVVSCAKRNKQVVHSCHVV